MKLGMVGLGRMGGNMTERLLNDGHELVVYDPNPSTVGALAANGASPASSLVDLVGQLASPKTVWVMVPAGDITEKTVNDLVALLGDGDTVIDGGNSNYKESQRRAEFAAASGIDFLDSGTSGGVWGLANGYCLTVGGNRAAYDRNRPIFKTLAPPDSDGNLYVGPSGSGHYTKMIHNGIEYGMMQAYAEGFELLAAKTDFELDLGAIAENWRRGSVIRSWLLDLVADELEREPALDSLSSYVDDSGEGRWTVDASIELAVPAPVITAALQMRFRSRQDNPLGGRMLAAMRRGFGGHAVKKSDG
ncbi:MAG: decarboxylating 6-phosphogluconate dehydrogenase [Chloroflexi bacterium]|nr:decarboxylating 6-phosphogluconate dehydrogenase [Chloroflexota bacterium]